jgi:hypothetical protein
MKGHDYLLKRINLKRNSKKVYLKKSNPITREVVFVKYPDEALVFPALEKSFINSVDMEEFRKKFSYCVRFVRRDVEICKYYESGNG